MDYTTQVNEDFVRSVIEQNPGWSKAGVKVNLNEEAPAAKAGAPEEAEAEVAVNEEELVSFSLDDLQVVLDNLEEDALLEHASNMLDVFDAAYAEMLNEAEEEYYEEE